MRVLLLNQCFWPDVAATAHQLTALARGLRERGHEVTVITGSRGYADGKVSFPRREVWNGITIIRVSALTLGKKARWRRALNFASFLFTCAGRLIVMPRQDIVVALTSPPLISWLGSLFVRLKGGRLIFWAMDLNPDEAIAAGWLKENSFAARWLSRLLKSSLDRATTIVALDRFMKDRIVAKGIAERKIEVVPPGGDEEVRYDERGRETFRLRHGLTKKFVVMYAGNHSPCNPLDSVLESAKALRQRSDILFLFVGGGSEQDKVKEAARRHRLENIRCLPYQPPADLSGVLSAADLHVVVMGDAFTGIIHPSKIYNIMAVGAPFIFVGPTKSHIGDIMAAQTEDALMMQARHDQAAEIANLISKAADLREIRRRVMLSDEFSPRNLLRRMIALVENAGAASNPAVSLEASARTSESQI